MRTSRLIGGVVSAGRGGRLGSAVVVGLLVAGCGSTVAGQGAASSSGALSSGSPGSSNLSMTGTGTGAVPGGQGQPAGAAAGSVGAAGTGSGAVSSGAGSSASAAVGGGVAKAAVSATSITIGVGYTSNGNAANAAIGAAGISQGDPVGESNAVIKYINSHGGVAGGRKLVPVFHPYDATSTGSTASQDQSACSDYTQDHHVFAVADSGLTDTLPACLRKAGVLMAYSGDIIKYDNSAFRAFPNYVDVGTLSEDRFMAAEVQVLQRRGWFSPWDTTNGAAAATGKAKVGVLTIDGSWWMTPVHKILLPALARAGYPVSPSDVQAVTQPTTTSEESQTVTDIQSAALHFRADGVTHVVFTDPDGVLTLIFGRNAQGQHYFPRYGVSSGSGMQALVTAGDVDPSVLRGAIGLGWAPGLDLTANAAAKYQTPSTATCLTIMKSAGYTFPDVNSEGIALSICDELFFLADVINRAAPNFTLPAALNAVAAIGDSFHAAGDPLSFLSATRHDALQEGFDMQWNTNCGCATYLGNGYQIPNAND